MIHQGRQTQNGTIKVNPDFIEDVLGRKFASQMQEMLDAEGLLFCTLFKRRHHLRQDDAPKIFLARVEPATNGIIDRGDSRRRHLGVIGDRRSQMVRPIGARPWNEMLLHIVRMHLDDARRDKVAFDIFRAWQAGRAASNGSDQTVAQNNGAANDLVFKDEVGVGQDNLGHAASGCLAVMISKRAVATN